MKLPNFRLYDTQAAASMWLGLLGAMGLLLLCLFVFKGFDAEHMNVVYDPKGSLGQLRNPLVMVGTAGTLLAGVIAAVVGFRSIGEKRNTKQGRSWLGMMLGALCAAAAPVLFYAWRQFAEPIIRNLNE